MTASLPSVPAPVLDRVKGQPEAVGVLRGALRAPLHAYLFLGPPGSGRLEASIAFAAALLCPEGGCGECASCREALALRHPDLEVVERVGASILVKQAREVARLALRTPRAARYQVLVLADFHLVDEAAPALLKTIEEPPDTTVIIITAETIPSPFVTIASRCVQVPFKPLGDETIIEVLMGEGVEVATAHAVAEVAGGRLDRARLLARDPGFAARLQRWKMVPGRLDGTGARVAQIADELLASIAEPVEVVRARQGEEIARLQAEAERRGEKVIPGRSLLEERHRASCDGYAPTRSAPGSPRSRQCAGTGSPSPRSPRSGSGPRFAAIEAINEASLRLTRNVNATMLLQWLLLHLDT